jgi:exodeoxyribonuclease VII large subunit
VSNTPGHGEVWSVSRLVLEVKSLLASKLVPLWVEGEVSNLTRSAAGHRYFALKDDNNLIRCALFRGRAAQLRFEPKDGQKVVALGRVDLYGPRSELQLVVDELLPAGEGELERAFRELYEKLKREGLFEPGRKRPLPLFPRRLGVVTSARGAALRDILKVLSRRAPHVQVIVADTLVQGAQAAHGVVGALDLFNRRGDVDVILLARGGGSLEDLAAFNDESVVRAVRASRLPVVTGIGHEIDTTLADLAADLRAPTPSAAAEVAAPARSEWLDRLRLAQSRLRALVQAAHADGSDRLSDCTSRYGFRRPEEALRTFAQRVDQLSERITTSMPLRLREAAAALAALSRRPALRVPWQSLEPRRSQLDQSLGRLAAAWTPLLAASRERFAHQCGSLQALSPAGVLDRGYAVLLSPSGNVVTGVQQVTSGQELSAVLKDGTLSARVLSKENKRWWP